jgi:hypothetical protein
MLLLVACGLLPGGTTGQVKGVLKTDDKGPMEGVPVSLAQCVETDDGRQVTTTFKDGLWQGGVAQTKTDSRGAFLFEDIPSGEYELFLFSKPLIDNQGNYVICKVSPGRTFNLGTILFEATGDDKYRLSYEGPPSVFSSPLVIIALVILTIVAIGALITKKGKPKPEQDAT